MRIGTRLGVPSPWKMFVIRGCLFPPPFKKKRSDQGFLGFFQQEKAPKKDGSITRERESVWLDVWMGCPKKEILGEKEDSAGSGFFWVCFEYQSGLCYKMSWQNISNNLGDKTMVFWDAPKTDQKYINPFIGGLYMELWAILADQRIPILVTSGGQIPKKKWRMVQIFKHGRRVFCLFLRKWFGHHVRQVQGQGSRTKKSGKNYLPALLSWFLSENDAQETPKG